MRRKYSKHHRDHVLEMCIGGAVYQWMVVEVVNPKCKM